MRVDNWPTILQSYIAEARAREFSWGDFDCCLFPCDVILAMTGLDPARSFRGKYKSKRGAYGQLRRQYGGGVREAADAILGGELEFPEVGRAFAQRGDVGLISTPDGDALALCVGARWVIPNPVEGLTYIGTGEVIKAWRVG